MEELKNLLLEWEFIVNEISDFVDKVIDGQITNETDNIQEFCDNLYSKADNILEKIDSLNKDKTIWSDDEYKQFQLIDCNLKNSIEKLKNFFNKGKIC